MFFYSPVIFFRFYNKLTFTLFNLQKQYLDKFLTNTTFLNKYLYLNDVLWQEGFLIDFVQKKTTDKFIRKFLIHSMYLFNERLLFDKIIRVFSVTIQDVTAHATQFDTNSVASVLFILLILIAGLISLGGMLIILSSVWTIC